MSKSLDLSYLCIKHTCSHYGALEAYQVVYHVGLFATKFVTLEVSLTLDFMHQNMFFIAYHVESSNNKIRLDFSLVLNLYKGIYQCKSFITLKSLQ